MNVTLALFMGAFGMASGWFIPLIAFKIAEYKLKKSSRALIPDTRFTSRLLKLLCLLVNGALWAAVGLFAENLLHAALLAVILFDAEVITIIDIRIRLIPNEAVLTMLLAGFIMQISLGGATSLIAAIITMIVVMAVFIALGSMLGFTAIGAGDVKLAGAMGLILGYPHIMYGMIGMSAVMLVWCSTGLITRKLTVKSMFAFAPFMMAGTAFAIITSVPGY
ncbi:prepilin peptidase [Oscillospiraceae bacterium CM]|nr:prepilin peptidase [Oscillospiraceae bacterium CM]